jgi:hypothetical protein
MVTINSVLNLVSAPPLLPIPLLTPSFPLKKQKQKQKTQKTNQQTNKQTNKQQQRRRKKN